MRWLRFNAGRDFACAQVDQEEQETRQAFEMESGARRNLIKVPPGPG